MDLKSQVPPQNDPLPPADLPAFRLRADGTVAEANAAWRALHGQLSPGDAADSLVGHTFEDLCREVLPLETDRRSVLVGLRAVLGGAQTSFRYDYLVALQGRPAWFRLILEPLADGGVLATHADVTLAKGAESAFGQLLESPMDALLVVDARGYVQLANARAEAMFGYSRDELVGGGLERLLPERFRGRHAGHRAGFFAAPHARPMGTGLELFAQGKDGREFPVEISLTPLATEGGQVVVAAIRDVSALKQGEASLKRAETRAQLALEVARIGTWTWMPEADELLADARCRELCGFRSGTPLAFADIEARVHPEDWSRVEAALRAAFDPRGMGFAEELRLVHPDGDVRWVSARGQVHKERGTASPVLLGTVLDITTRKRSELNQAFLARVEADLVRLERSADILRCAGGHACGYLGLARLTFWAVDETSGSAATMISVGRADAAVPPYVQSLEGLAGSDAWQDLKAGNPVVVADCSSDPRTGGYALALGAHGVHSGVLVPSLGYGELRLLLAATDDRPRAWRPDEVALLRELAARTTLRLERADAEAALREREARYRTLFDAIDQGFCIIEVITDAAGVPADYRFLEVNPVFEQQTGLVAAVGKTALGLIPTLERRWIDLYGEVALGGGPRRFTDEAGASGRIYDVYAVRVGNAADKRVAVLFADVTERLEAERALRDAQQRLALHVRRTPLAVIEWRLGDHLITAWNPAAERVFGYRADEVVDRLPADRLLTEDDPQFGAVIAGRGETTGVRQTSRNRTKDGRVILCEWYTTLLTDGTGAATGGAALALDVTARQRAVEALLTAQDEERTRISRDLHDGVGQALTAISLGLGAALERPDPAGQRGRLQGVKELVAKTLEDVRRISRDLRPALLDELGLEAAVKHFARDLAERSGTEVDVLARLPQRLPRNAEAAVYRVVQEALTNVARHARATHASIVLTASDERLHLIVEDDGDGFVPAEPAATVSVGLLGMRERVELLGGSLRLESTPGRGTIISARLPLQKPGSGLEPVQGR